MRKVKVIFINLILLIALLSVFPVTNVNAMDDTEVVAEEDTPESSFATRNFWIAGYGLVFIVAIYYASIRSNEDNRFRLQVTNVEDNGDGSYIVKVGYKNLTNHHQTVNQNDSKIKMTKGTAIVLDKKDIKDLAPATTEELVTLAVSDDSNVEISVEKQNIKVDLNLLEEWRREHAKAENETKIK